MNLPPRRPHVRSLLIGGATTVVGGVVASELALALTARSVTAADSPADSFLVRLFLYSEYAGGVLLAWLLAGMAGGRWFVTPHSLRLSRWIGTPALGAGAVGLVQAMVLGAGGMKGWGLLLLGTGAAFLGGLGGWTAFLSESRIRSANL